MTEERDRPAPRRRPASRRLAHLAGAAGFAARTGARRLLRGAAQESGGVVGRTTDDRNAELVALGGKLGAAEAAHRARKLFASAERREALDEEHLLRTAAQVRDTLGGMKGVLMKLAQMQSFLNDDLPDAWKVALAQLQSDAPPMSGELAAGVVSAGLGAEPTDLFAEWDPVPFAAASIGQVHRAISHDGRAVAVKVQYPAAADALTADLDNFDGFLRIVLSAASAGDGEDAAEVPSIDDLRPLVTEIRTRISEEVDYGNEARSQARFAEYFAGHPFITIPAVVPELSCATVLTTELVDGARFAELETWSQRERDLAGETVFRFVQHSVFRLGAYNGDPHPGNYLFSPGGRVAFLDFGLVKNVDDVVTRLLARVFEQGIHAADAEAFADAMRDAGFIKPGADIEPKIVFELVAQPWAAIIADEVTAMPFPQTDMRPPSQRTDEERALGRAFELPAQFVILMRTLVGMQALLARLGSVGHWRGIASQIWPFSAAAPATDLGHEEAPWLAARGQP